MVHRYRAIDSGSGARASKITATVEALGEFQASLVEAAGGPPDKTRTHTDIVVKLGD
jgi:hypothetical protein